MSNIPTSWDPYSAPQAPQVVAPQGPLPAGLKAVCIIAIVLGGLGILFSCFGAFGLIAGQATQSAFEMPGPAGGDMAQAQREMQTQIMEATRAYQPYLIVSVLLHVFAAIALLFGGILALKVSATGRLVLLAGCALATLYELVQSVLSVLVQSQTLPITQKYMEQALPPGGPANLPPGFSKAMVVVMLVFAGIGLLLSLVKIVFYVFSIIYLQRAHIVARYTA
jgi:hypothetical protein